ncbi:urease accessory protein UreF [Labrys sp. WJW]|uniref:urease accessory protein UreF n=1 Tax=Labrys sp. WJW TaxID=1737983 RepID=UPI0008361E36|nr:urease accessory protein UreF [Labrys sp. WJW]
MVMTDDTAHLVRLLSWLSPAFPVGAFAYSHGLERAVHDGLIEDRPSLVDWLSAVVQSGSGWNDAVLLAEAWRLASRGEDCTAVAELGEAMAGTRERHRETMLQGEAFGQAVSHWTGEAIEPMPYPIAVGQAAAHHGIGLEQALAGFLHAFTANLVQAAIRLVPLGQRDGVQALATLEPIMLATAKRACHAALDDLGACTLMSDIVSMQHETQYSRIFRS